tara:strand:- start:83 stop:352 length:270 start_codon:yes stop_codon:yes gene_type:complete
MKNSSTGRTVANQFIIYGEDATYFQSYNTVIAKIQNDYPNLAIKTTLQTGYWDNYSATTNKYLNQFLGTSGVAEIREKVKNGIYEVGNI